jgi:hypothetical protein
MELIIKEDVDEGSISWGKLGILVEVMYLIEVNLIISLIYDGRLPVRFVLYQKVPLLMLKCSINY